MKTKVHYSDLLTAITGKLVSVNGVRGMYDIYNAVAGPGVQTTMIAYMAPHVQSYLREKYPSYATDEVNFRLEDTLLQCKRLHPDVDDNIWSTMKSYMDRDLLPIFDSEFVEVEKMSELALSELMRDYSDYLEKLMQRKPNIVVVAPG
jgi:hypothetical protein